ncbi:peptide synthetase [Fusarium flagelliforme]|uniref:peptide synthetase n=1 Tax=Fusarium flagelliforme TaxID=2675880 RepID=UPI001E8D4500|nr:peptide synthetase [Fusarium flagelliforme]KAH7182279.1 peptide synthetase [Fusarium flagelliforme]
MPPIIFDDAATPLGHTNGAKEETIDNDILPFSTLGAISNLEDLLSEIRKQCNLYAEESIQDAYVCTEVQKSIIEANQSPVVSYAYRLVDDCDADRFKSAWEQCLQICNSLRARIVSFNRDIFQAIIKEGPVWEARVPSELSLALDALASIEITHGSRLCHYALHEDHDGKKYFLFVAHQAIVDGWTMRLVLETLHRFYYDDDPLDLLQQVTLTAHMSNSPNMESTRQYWEEKLHDAKPSAVLRLRPPETCTPRTLRHIVTKMPLSDSEEIITNREIILRAAWALLLSHLSDSENVTFGQLVSGRQAPVAGIEKVLGSVAPVVPIVLKVDQTADVKSFLLKVQAQAAEMAPHEHFGLQNISKINSDSGDLCDFSSVLVIHEDELNWRKAATRLLERLDDEEPPPKNSTGVLSGYPLAIDCSLLPEHVKLRVCYNPNRIDRVQAEALLHQFDRIVQQLLPQDESPLASISPQGIWDIEQATTWNNEDIPEVVENCVHYAISRQAQKRPHDIAIDAWDGKLTYHELDCAANRLAHYLIDFGVKTEDLVIVCFEKSMWFCVAILAINKAGAAWVPLDPQHPKERHQQVIQQTKASLALTSSGVSDLCEGLGLRVITIGDTFDKALQEGRPREVSLPEVSPRNAAYVLFTSGSTGTPKGFLTEHGAICSSQKAVCKRLGLTSEARMLQFASHVFDACVYESLFTLMVGGCLCVPSDHIRLNKLPEFMSERSVTWAAFIPSFLRTLSPYQVPSLQALISGGEAFGRDLLEVWSGKCRLINVWGPAECCPITAIHEWLSPTESPLTIGRPVGSFCWIVDPQNPRKPAPIGCIGEIMIQGPTLLREYLSDIQKTNDTVMTNLPEWMPRRHEPGWSKCYKSGDLAYYNPDGTMEFAGRKDTQVKIRGLRVELGEIEYTIKRATEVSQVAVETLSNEATTILVAYLCFNQESRVALRGQGNDKDEADIFLPLTDTLRRQIQDLKEYLQRKLPHYMVPTMFIPCAYMPFITSTKLDRKRLRQLPELLTQEQRAEYSLVSFEKIKPETTLEISLQEVWASILNIDQDSIGRHDSFLQLGGDSINVIQLVSLARQQNIGLTVASILKDPRLSSVAASATIVDGGDAVEVPSFSLLPHDQKHYFIEQAREQCGLTTAQVIKDILPCTPLQEGLMALSITQPGSYMARFAVYPPGGSDMSDLLSALNTTVKHVAILRTRIILVPEGCYQVILSEDMNWQSAHKQPLSELTSSTPPSVGYGKSLSLFTMTEDNGGPCVLWDLHHSLYDGFSFLRIVKILQNALGLSTETVHPVPLSNYVKFVQSIDPLESKTYWTQQLEGANTMQFPPKTTAQLGPSCEGSFSHAFRIPHRQASDVTLSNLLRGAWALLLSRYLDTNDVEFGCTVSGRSGAISQIENVLGPTLATVPVRVQMNRNSSIAAFLKQVQQQSNDMIPYEHTGLQTIARYGEEFRQACDIRNQLIVQPAEIFGAAQTPELSHGLIKSLPNSGRQFDAFPLVMECVLDSEGSIELHAHFDTGVIAPQQIQAICGQFGHVVTQLVTKPRNLLSDISFCGPEDVKRVMEWNAQNPPKLVYTRVQDLISDQTKRQPHKVAIHSWDGRFTYSELDKLSDSFAWHLSFLGVAPEKPVAVCVDKSKWAVVTMLAVMKSGGVYVPLDPAYPRSRLQALLERTQADLVLVSPTTASLFSDMALRSVVVSSQLILELPDLDTSASSNLDVRPEHAAYIAFTSGSTGQPKGIVVEHASLCSSIMGHGGAYGLGPESRMLQFSNFTFDGSLSEILTPLVFGGTVCMPSDTQRLQHVTKFIQDAQVNVAILTPSFADTIRPDDVRTLDTLVLSGEVITKDQLELWCGRVKLINAYGPSEVCVDCATHIFKSPEDSPTKIGVAHNATLWIVEPDDHDQLAPVGCIGEVLVQGPSLARGYYGDEIKTKEVFLDNLKWLPQSRGDKYTRLYKTGDLARYNHDGTIEYLGRKDTQVKLRGQRVELGEIEYNIKKDVTGLEHVAVEVVHRGRTDILVAFLAFDRAQQDDADNLECILVPNDDTMRTTLARLLSDLQASLPAYMVPSIFLPLKKMPFVSSMKIDRKRLRDLVKNLSPFEFAGYSNSSKDTTPPTTDMEIRLRDLWAQVLHIKAEKIGKNDNFLRIGGDSIGAIQLASLARKHGIEVAVTSIFKDARLCRVAESATLIDGNFVESDIAPFSLLPVSLAAEAKEQCKLGSDERIEDIYPCTPLQEGIMALTATNQGSYTARNVFKVPENVDVDRFKHAWCQTVRSCANLRTRIIVSAGITAQVVVKDDIYWYDEDSINVEDGMTYGSRLCRYSLTKRSDSDTYFTWIMHHTIFDGWSGNLMREQLQSFYHQGAAPQLNPYNRFIKYVVSLDRKGCEEYWRKQLLDVKQTSFPLPRLQKESERVRTGSCSKSASHNIPFTQSSGSSITVATIIRAAWTIVIARYCDTDDVCFGTSVSGRNAPVPGLDSMTGPTIATVPVRVHLDKEKSVEDFLQDIQTQASEMVAFEQFGLQNIANLSESARQACDFQSLLAIQPAKLLITVNNSDSVISLTDEASEGSFNYPLVVQVWLHDDHIQLDITYDPLVLDDSQITTLSNRFDVVVQQLSRHRNEGLLSQVSIRTPRDIQQAVSWNSETPEVTDSCIHDLIAEQADLRPDVIAVDAWDKIFTYAGLNEAVNKLAYHLRFHACISKEELVPVCFEKSAWFFVAILAINKAGAAWVPLDPSQPNGRHQQVVKQTHSKSAVTSPTNAKLCSALGLNVVIVDAASMRTLGEGEGSPFSETSSQDVAYVMFTSGSTGTPKGVVLEHGSVCASQLAAAKKLGMTSDTTMLQFSSYAFDAFVTEAFATLFSGGRVCVPSDQDRMDSLAEFMRDKNVNWALLTPSLARTLRPEDVPGLQVLLLGGEACGTDILSEWHGKARIINCWGPVEACVMSAFHVWESPTESPLTIGRPVGCNVWILESNDNLLKPAPVGCVGDLFIQGPNVLREYLSDPIRTKEVVLPPPKWMPKDKGEQIYKTGDLGYYNPDGTIQFVGRADSQVKIRGLRVELGEVESSIQTVSAIRQVAVDVFEMEAGKSLVAYLCFHQDANIESPISVQSSDDNLGDIFLPLTDDRKTQVDTVVRYLAEKLPRYMIPTIFIPCSYMPVITSTKLDRGRLRNLTIKLGPSRITEYSLVDSLKRPPQTEMERQVQALFASVLKVEPDSIGRDDSYLKIGGDSINAIQLVTLARQKGFVGLTVAAIFRDSRLSHLAHAIVKNSASRFSGNTVE